MSNRRGVFFWLVFVLVVFGLLVFIPDPLDLTVVGTFLEAVSLVVGLGLWFGNRFKSLWG